MYAFRQFSVQTYICPNYPGNFHSRPSVPHSLSLSLSLCQWPSFHITFQHFSASRKARSSNSRPSTQRSCCTLASSLTWFNDDYWINNTRPHHRAAITHYQTIPGSRAKTITIFVNSTNTNFRPPNLDPQSKQPKRTNDHNRKLLET